MTDHEEPEHKSWCLLVRYPNIRELHFPWCNCQELQPTIKSKKNVR